MFVLNGGPRAGQLVDDLPRGYRLLTDGRTAGPTAMIIAGTSAAVAVWHHDTAIARRASDH